MMKPAIQARKLTIIRGRNEVLHGISCTVKAGTVTSQLFANVYLHELDWYMKQQLGVCYYVRYCDDFVVVSHDRNYLERLIEVIRSFLWAELRLELHPTKIIIRSWRQGVDFLGFVLMPRAITIRTKTKRRMTNRVTTDNLSSYLGICSHANAYRLTQLLKILAWQAGTGHDIHDTKNDSEYTPESFSLDG